MGGRSTPFFFKPRGQAARNLFKERAMGNGNGRQLDHPVFAQPQATADPSTFKVTHPSDGAAYKAIDQLNLQNKINPMPFDKPRGDVEPVLTMEEVFGGNSAAIQKITASGQIVFHATGDCGSTRGPKTQSEVTDKMVGDFNESDPKEIPQFNFLLGDIVYSFGESQYYYDQFYEPYRDYPAPILAAAGNHDGMVSPLDNARTLEAFQNNFCAEGFTVTPEAGGLSRTAQIQPGVYYTLDAPFVRILVLYSNTLEDPGVIADGGAYGGIGTWQLDFLTAALTRARKEKFGGALLIASHHPAYTAGSKHGWSQDMTAQVDKICAQAGFWPHAVLAGHAHSYQRFTRTRPDGTQIPYIVCGNGGHNVQRLTKGAVPLRTPQVIQAASTSADQVVFENYDDQNYGYLRIVATGSQLRIEYHPASDGVNAKTPDDSVTVDLQKRVLTNYVATDMGTPAAARAIRQARGPSAPKGRAAKGRATRGTAPAASGKRRGRKGMA
jgi:hypothetical protein